MSRYSFSPEFPITRLLSELIQQCKTGCLQVSDGRTSWFLLLNQGRLCFATNSIDPFGRFDRQLGKLSAQIPTLVGAIRIQMRWLFEVPDHHACQDYQAIEWLVAQRHLAPAHAAILVEELAKEVIESLLSVQIGKAELVPFDPMHPPQVFCNLDLPALLEFCQNRWRYHQYEEQLTPVGAPVAVGPIGVQDRPTIVDSEIALREVELRASPTRLMPNQLLAAVQSQRPYKVACIDDSPAVLRSIQSYLNDEYFSVIAISDPIKALVQIVRSKPDLILLDVTMPQLDGYELCSLLRRHPQFRRTPVVMITGSTGLIDRAKARLVGASGYLTKPFTQPDLVKMVFKHLN